MTSTSQSEDRRIRSLRPPKPVVDPWKAHGHVLERERRPRGEIERALTVFLAGSECPFTCAFCDLWRYTTDAPTPRGALGRQLRDALDRIDISAVQRVKLYNASNFFDARAVPTDDWPELAELGRRFPSVTVESHASMVGDRALAFARMLGDTRLEIAIGLETVHADALSRLNKRIDVADFDRAADYVVAHGMELRVFVLVGAPFVPAEESLSWIARTVRHAVSRGASVVSLIPLRDGNGEMERLRAGNGWTPPTLRDVEAALEECISVPAVVTADLWDVTRFAHCDACRDARVQRLERFNFEGTMSARGPCARCGE